MQSLTGKITGSNLTAAEWNQLPQEVQNVIAALGIALSSGDLNQLGSAIAGYVANGTFGTDSGAADAYVVTRIGSKQAAPAYTDGFKVSFIVGNTNTGASTVNVDTLGVSNLFFAGAAMPAGYLVAGDRVEFAYDLANTRFNLVSIPRGYEEGSWTPELWDASLSGSEGQTYNLQEGYYTRVGRMVSFTGRLRMTALGTLAANMRVGNLPFLSKNTVSTEQASVAVSASGMVITSGESVSGTIAAAADSIALFLWDSTTGSTSLQVGEIGTSFDVTVAGVYFI